MSVISIGSMDSAIKFHKQSEPILRKTFGLDATGKISNQ